MTPTSLPLIIEPLRTEREFRALEAEWRALLPKTSADGLFMTWDYVITWWETFGAHCRPCVFTARQKDGRLLGIAPFMTSRDPNYLHGIFTELRLMGDFGGVTPELQDFIIVKGMEEVIGKRFYEAVRAGRAINWDILSLSFVSPDSAVFRCLPTLDDQLLVQMHAEPAPFAQLPKDWETFQSGLSGRFRRELRRRVKKLHSDHQVEVWEPTSPQEVLAALETVERLNHLRWGKAGQAFATEDWVRFHRAFACKCLENGWLSLQILRVDGREAAAAYDFRYGGELLKYQGGWLPELRSQALATILIAWSMEDSIAKGLDRYDFLAGAADYKLDWATDSRDLLTIRGFRRTSARATFFQVASGARNWARGCAEAVRFRRIQAEARGDDEPMAA